MVDEAAAACRVAEEARVAAARWCRRCRPWQILMKSGACVITRCPTSCLPRASRRRAHVFTSGIKVTLVAVETTLGAPPFVITKCRQLAAAKAGEAKRDERYSLSSAATPPLAVVADDEPTHYERNSLAA